VPRGDWLQFRHRSDEVVEGWERTTCPVFWANGPIDLPVRVTAA
jgi:hypothetical protein